MEQGHIRFCGLTDFSLADFVVINVASLFCLW